MLDVETLGYIARNGRCAFIQMIEKLPTKIRAQYNLALTRWEQKHKTYAGEYQVYPHHAVDDAREIMEGKI